MHAVRTGGAQSAAVSASHEHHCVPRGPRVPRGQQAQRIRLGRLPRSESSLPTRSEYRKSVSHFLGIETPARSCAGSDVGPAHCVSEVRTKTSVSSLFNAPIYEAAGVRVQRPAPDISSVTPGSTGRQTLGGQHDVIKAAGVDRIFDDVMSGTPSDRPGLAAAFDYVRGLWRGVYRAGAGERRYTLACPRVVSGRSDLVDPPDA